MPYKCQVGGRKDGLEQEQPATRRESRSRGVTGHVILALPHPYAPSRALLRGSASVVSAPRARTAGAGHDGNRIVWEQPQGGGEGGHGADLVTLRMECLLTSRTGCVAIFVFAATLPFVGSMAGLRRRTLLCPRCHTNEVAQNPFLCNSATPLGNYMFSGVCERRG